MKKLLFILLLLMFTPIVSFGQQDIERFKIYDTTNSYISLMLDTMTGESWMVQIGLSDSDAVRIVINDYQYSYSEETAKQKYEDALKTWEEYFSSGYYKAEAKDFYGAISDYNKAIEINPNYAGVYFNRALSKEFLGDLTGACADAKKAISLGANF